MGVNFHLPGKPIYFCKRPPMGTASTDSFLEVSLKCSDVGGIITQVLLSGLYFGPNRWLRVKIGEDPPSFDTFNHALAWILGSTARTAFFFDPAWSILLTWWPALVLRRSAARVLAFPLRKQNRNDSSECFSAATQESQTGISSTRTMYCEAVCRCEAV